MNLARITSVGLMVAASLLSGPRSAQAQQTPDPSLPSTFGMTNLKAGFTPDPFVKTLTAGGVLKTNLGGVSTHVARAPDFKLTYAAGNLPLILHVDSRADTTLLVNLPNGTWVANDDGAGNLNPMLKFDRPLSGRYDIYVGAVANVSTQATLYITERAISTDAPNPGLPATFGAEKLKVGFVPDPVVRKVTAGGSIKTALGGVKAHVARAPDVTLEYSAGKAPLTIHVDSRADTTLLINLPNGTWIANDDGGVGQNRLNPRLSFVQPPSGRYDIYIGTVAAAPADATLYITELK